MTLSDPEPTPHTPMWIRPEPPFNLGHYPQVFPPVEFNVERNDDDDDPDE